LRLAWSAPVVLVDGAGAPYPADEIAGLALYPSTVEQARARLVGVDLSKAVQAEQRATAAGADVLGGLANVKVGKEDHDVVILDRGLVLVPSHGKAEEGRHRLAWLVRSATVAELARRHWFPAYGEGARATVLKRLPARVDLVLHDGRTVSLRETWSGQDLGDKSRAVLLAALAPFTRAGD